MTAVVTTNKDDIQQKKDALTESSAPRGYAMNTPFPKWAAGCRSAPKALLVSDCSQAEMLSGAACCNSATVRKAIHAAHAEAELDHRPPSLDHRHVVQGIECKALVAARLGSAAIMGRHLYAQGGSHVAALPHVVRHPLQLQRMEAAVVEQRHCDGCARLILHRPASTSCHLLHLLQKLHDADKAYLVLESLGTR